MVTRQSCAKFQFSLQSRVITPLKITIFDHYLSQLTSLYTMYINVITSRIFVLKINLSFDIIKSHYFLETNKIGSYSISA